MRSTEDKLSDRGDRMGTFAAEHERKQSALVRTLLHAVDLGREAVPAFANGGKYTVKWTPGTVEQLASGTLRWHDVGGFEGVLRRPDGTIAQHLRLDQLGPDVHRLVVGLATQATLAAIREQLDRIEAQLADVRRELLQDRLAEVDSAQAQVEAAVVMRDPDTRRLALLNAAQTAQTAYAKLVRYLRAEIEAGVSPPSTLSQILAPWSDPRDRYKTKVERLQAAALGAARVAGLVVDTYAALGEPEAAGVAMRMLHAGLADLGLARVVEWARWTDPALRAEELWEVHLPLLVRHLEEGVETLDQRPAPLEIELPWEGR